MTLVRYILLRLYAIFSLKPRIRLMIDNINLINKHTLKQLFEKSSKIGISNDALSKRIRCNHTFSCTKNQQLIYEKQKVTTTCFLSTTQIP